MEGRHDWMYSLLKETDITEVITQKIFYNLLGNYYKGKAQGVLWGKVAGRLERGFRRKTEFRLGFEVTGKHYRKRKGNNVLRQMDQLEEENHPSMFKKQEEVFWDNSDGYALNISGIYWCILLQKEVNYGNTTNSLMSSGWTHGISLNVSSSSLCSHPTILSKSTCHMPGTGPSTTNMTHSLSPGNL